MTDTPTTKSKWRRWHKITLGIVGALILLLVVAAIVDDPPEEDTTVVAETDPGAEEEPAAEPTPEPEPEAVEDDPIPGTLGYGPDEFVERWNAAASEFGSDELRIPRIDVEEGEVQDVFQHEFADYAFLQGAANKADGTIRELVILAQPQGADQALTVLTSWGILIAAASPDLSPDERGDVLSEMRLVGDDSADDFTDHEGEAVRGNVRFWFRGSDTVGLWFAASDARE